MAVSRVRIVPIRVVTRTTCTEKLVENFLLDIRSLEHNLDKRGGVPVHVLTICYECTLLYDIRTDLQPWVTLDKPDICPAKPGPGGHSTIVCFFPQFGFNVFECTLFVTGIIRKFDKDATILLVRLKGKDLEPVRLDDREAGLQFT